MRVAAAAWPLDPLADWDAFEEKAARWVRDAAASGAELLVFPEYGGVELAALSGLDAAGDEKAALAAADAAAERAAEIWAGLAAANNAHLLAPSAPERGPGGGFVNRARFFAPGGPVGFQDKLIMTRYEREALALEPGAGLTVFDTALGRIGVAICYDVEFPLIARALVEAGVELLLAPSCTETAFGYWRVRVGAQARALEGQCVAVHSPTVGPAPWCPVADANYGAAGVYGPPDIGFPEDGVIALGARNRPGWTFADIDLAAIRAVRSDGGVLNATHWAEQDERLRSVEVVAAR